MAFSVSRRVDQCLALLDGGLGRHDMFITSAPRRLPASSKEALRARRGLEEQVDLRAPAQCRGLLLDLPRQIDVAISQIEKRGDFEMIEPLDAEQMPAGEDRRRGLGCAH